MARRFERLVEQAPEYWTAAELGDADIIVHPHHYIAGERTERTAELARKAGLPCLFFRQNDSHEPAEPSYGQVYRTSIMADERTPVEHGMPDFCDDPLRDRDGRPAPLERPDKPTIGFCGFVGSPLRRFAYRWVGEYDKVAGLIIRELAMRAFEGNERVHSAFIRRKSFWNGAVMRGSINESARAASRRDFVENLFNNAYNLCARGKGNFSTRFYEVLAAGRIPVFINTSCVLPFEDEIDYRKHCVWIEEPDLPRAGEIVADFHAALDEDAFRQMQLDNRALWERWFEPTSFYKLVIGRAVGAGNDQHPTGSTRTAD